MIPSSRVFVCEQCGREKSSPGLCARCTLSHNAVARLIQEATDSGLFSPQPAYT